MRFLQIFPVAFFLLISIGANLYYHMLTNVKMTTNLNRRIILLLLILPLVSCNDFAKEDEQSISQGRSSEPVEREITWDRNNIGNITFNLPSILSKNRMASNDEQTVFTSDDNSIGLTISSNSLPAEFVGKEINEIIQNPSEFANSINAGNRQNFSDFRIIDKVFTSLGDSKSFLVNQTSNQVSGQNKKMAVEAFFLVSGKDYVNVTVSFLSVRKDVATKLKSSFSFPEPEKITKSVASNEPTLEESVQWLLQKFNSYTDEYTNYSEPSMISLPTKSRSYNHRFSMEGNSLVVTYSYEFYEKYIDERTRRNYSNASLSEEMALRSSKEYKVSKRNNIKVIIPFEKIEENWFSKEKDYNGKCSFTILTYGRDITEFKDGTKSYVSTFGFEYDCSQEENLGERLNKAILHIKDVIPPKKSKSSEIF